MRTWRRVVGTAVIACFAVAVPDAAELQQRTVDAFDRYIAATEARMEGERADPARFLWVDRLADERRGEYDSRLSAGEVVIERLQTRDAEGDEIKIPKGMVHHWVATVMLPGVTLDQTLAMVRDYERYAEIYAPNVRKSALLEQDSDRYRSYLQLYMKKVVTAVVNSEYDVTFERLDERRAWVPSYATRLAEVEHPDTPEEREKPIGNDRGFLWRLNTYCSFVERDAGTVMQCESVSLSRGIPFMVSAFIRPFVTGIPRETLTFTLEAARRHLTAATEPPAGQQ